MQPSLTFGRLAIGALTLSISILAQTIPAPTGDANQPILDCPDANVTDFAVKILDGLAANGLVTFESLIVGISGGEEGYDLFASLAEYTNAYDPAKDPEGKEGYTLLVPSDAAFQAAGYGDGGNWLAGATNATDNDDGSGTDGSWGKLNAQQAIDLMKLHVLHGQWDASKLPDDGRNGVAPSFYQPHGKTVNLLKRAMDDIELRKREIFEGRSGPALQKRGEAEDAGARRVATVMRKSDNGGGVTIKTAYGDISSWAELPDLQWTGLKGWKLVPVDFVSPAYIR